MPQEPAQPNRSLIEGLGVLLGLVQRGQATGVRELARVLGLSPTRTQRYLATLAHLGFCIRTPDRKYAPGPGVHALSAISLSASGLAARALEVLPGLNDLGAIVALGVLWRDSVSYVYFSQPNHPDARILGKDQGRPATESVIGLLLLAWQSETSISEILPEKAKKLRPTLSTYRRQGFARRVSPDGSVSLAVPVGDPPFAGLALSEIPCTISEKEVLERLSGAAKVLAT